MKRKFKAKQNHKFFKKIIIVIIFSYILISVIYNGKTINLKNILLNSSLKNIINDKNYFLNIIDINIKTPKNIVYSSLNKIISKKDLMVFKEEYDSFDTYESSDSVYIEDPSPNKTNEPIVYIYNTHQLEAYNSVVFNDYNILPNVMIAAYTLKENLIKNNIEAIVETNNIKEYLNNNNLDYDYSYRASRYFMTEAKNKYNSLNYFIDIHRDSATIESTFLIKDDKEYARIMFVIGLGNSNYKENYSFMNAINNIFEEKVPGISKGILKKGTVGGSTKYNQDFHNNTLLIEVGGVENEIDEVYNTMILFSEVLAEYIKGDKDGN